MKELENWNTLTEKITRQWIRDYYDVEENEDLDYWWVSSDIGGIFEFADMFISFQNILDCYKHKVSKEKFHEWYWWCLDNQSIHISLAKFIISPEEKARKEKENLDMLKERVTFAQETFEKALRDYDAQK